MKNIPTIKIALRKIVTTTLKYSLVLVAVLGYSMATGCQQMNSSEVYDNLGATPISFSEIASMAEVETSSSGILYQVIRKSNGGNSPSKTSQVTVHYEGKLLDGTVFDSSYGSEPVTFGLDRVILGWQEGLQLMREGEQFILYIPPPLAYGAHGVPGVIPPNSALAFKVELIRID